MEEKRKFKRRHLIFYLRVFNRNNNNLIGYLVDITPEGVMLISEDPIKTNITFQFKMDLPTGIGKLKQLDFEAKSIWCKTDINPNFYDTGFQLLNVASNDIEIIENLIDSFGFHSYSEI